MQEDTIPETHLYRNGVASKQGCFSLLDLKDKSQIQSWLGSHGQVCIANPSSNILMHRRQHVERWYTGLRERTWVWVNEWEIILLSVHNHSAACLRMEIMLFIACRWCLSAFLFFFWACFLGTLICLIWSVYCRGGAFVLVDYIFVPMESHKACILPSVGLFFIVPLCSALLRLRVKRGFCS